VKYLWAAVFLLLAGCAAAPPVVVTAPPEIHRTFMRDIIPVSELKCLKEPNGDAVSTVRQSAKYIVEVKKAGQDCRQKLEGVREIIQQEQ